VIQHRVNTAASPPWRPSESGSPALRPKGSRNKLTEEVIAEVYADWCESGLQLSRRRESRPDLYVKVIAFLIRQLEAEFTRPAHEQRVFKLIERLAEVDAAERTRSS